MSQQHSVAEVYSEYIKLRQSGRTVEQAVRVLQPLVDQLPKNDVSQLTVMVQNWENFNGKYHKPNTHPQTVTPTSNASENRVTANSVESSAIGASTNAAPPKRTAIRPIKPLNYSTDTAQGLICPQCGKSNLRTDSYCYACGEILQPSRSSTKVFGDSIMNPRTRLGTAFFGVDSRIILIIRGAPKPLEYELEHEAVMGRSASESPMRPDIDLAIYDAENLGVSRLHATLKRQEDTIAITDLNSKNATHINGQRLHPHEIRVLRDGDEIRLGKLAMKIVFKHLLRRVE